MHRTTIMIPDNLRQQAIRQARERGVSLGELVREALRECLDRAERKKARAAEDPIFADTAVFEGDFDIAVALRHDDALYAADET